MGERTTSPSGSCSAAGLGAPPVAAWTGECIGIAATGAGAASGAAATMPPCGVRARRTDSSPSLISISARLDSSSRSMSFLILRRSMKASLRWIRGVTGSDALQLLQLTDPGPGVFDQAVHSGGVAARAVDGDGVGGLAVLVAEPDPGPLGGAKVLLCVGARGDADFPSVQYFHGLPIRPVERFVDAVVLPGLAEVDFHRGGGLGAVRLVGQAPAGQRRGQQRGRHTCDARSVHWAPSRCRLAATRASA